jgi:hypothetical protein
LSLWNALPGVEKRKKVGNRDTLIDQLWLAIEALPDPDPEAEAKRPSKQDAVIAMLRRPEGATIDEVVRATGWAAPHRARRLLRQPEEETWAHSSHRQRGAGRVLEITSDPPELSSYR